MSSDDAIFFAGQMGEYLDIPSILCEAIEISLINEDYKGVVDYILKRRKEICNQ